MNTEEKKTRSKGAASVHRNEHQRRVTLVRNGKACWYLPLKTIDIAIADAGLDAAQ